MNHSPYEILDVETDATAEEIKAVYRKFSMRLHPDQGGGAEEFRAMKDAYELLVDPERRRLYDETGFAGHGSKSEVLRAERIFRMTNMALAAVMYGAEIENTGAKVPPRNVTTVNVAELAADFLNQHVIADQMDKLIAEHQHRLVIAKEAYRRMTAPAGSPVETVLVGGRRTLVLALRKLTSDRWAARAAVQALEEADYRHESGFER